jgi:hypothetical protein
VFAGGSNALHIEVFMRPLQSVIAGVVVAVSLTPALAFAGKKKPAPTPATAAPGASALAEGRRLMAAGNYSEACPKIAQSESEAPLPVTALTVGICWEKAGKLASAWTAYKAAVDVANGAHQKKSAVAAQHAVTRIEPKLSRLTIKLPAGRPSGIEVRRDGDVVSDSDLGTAIPLDGGGHDVEVNAPGKKPWKKHVELADSGQSLAVDVPELEGDAPAPVAATEETPAPPPADKGSRGQTQRIAGIAVGSVGVLGVALGAVAGIEAKSTYDDALSKCGGHPSCQPGSPGLAERTTAGNWATVSDVAFVAGGAAIVGGIVLYFTAPHGSATTVGVAPAARGTGLSLVGRF